MSHEIYVTFIIRINGVNVLHLTPMTVFYITIFVKKPIMKSILGIAILSVFAISSAFGGKCEPLFTQTKLWGDVRQGSLQFPIPEATT